MSKYPKLDDGESFRVNLDKETIKFACCDCAKVHYWQFHHIKKNIWDIALFADRRATGQLRRHYYGSLQKNDTKKINHTPGLPRNSVDSPHTKTE